MARSSSGRRKVRDDGLGAFEALNDPSAPAPDRWTTCSMDYGSFYSTPPSSSPSRPSRRPSKPSAHPRDDVHIVLRNVPQWRQRARSSPRPRPRLQQHHHHPECECDSKWDTLSRELSECRSELQRLRLRARLGEEKSSSYCCSRESPTCTPTATITRARSPSPSRRRIEIDLISTPSEDSSRFGKKYPHCELYEDDKSCLEDTRDSEVCPESARYSHYKYFGFGGHGAKTSWGHNYPLGKIPPHSIKAPAEVI